MSIFPELPHDAPHEFRESLEALRERFPDWTIEGPAALHVWTAELTTHGGRSLHFLAGHTLDELAARLASATAP